MPAPHMTRHFPRASLIICATLLISSSLAGTASGTAHGRVERGVKGANVAGMGAGGRGKDEADLEADFMVE